MSSSLVLTQSRSLVGNRRLNFQLQERSILKKMPRSSIKTNINAIKSSSTRARGLMYKMETTPYWHMPSSHTPERTFLRPHSFPCRVYSRACFQNMLRPSSTGATAIANPVLSSHDVKRILFQKVAESRDELKKAFQLLDTAQNLTVTQSELQKTINTFLLPLTREQFRDLLAQIPLTSSGTVPYLEFLSKFGGKDLNDSIINRGYGTEMGHSRTLKELEIQLGDKVFRNIKTVIKAFKLLDVNGSGLVYPHQLRRVLETFCVKMSAKEYDMFSRHYSIGQNKVDYNVFLKTFSINHEMNLRHFAGNQDNSWKNQHSKPSSQERLSTSGSPEDVWENCSIEEIEKAFCQELLKSFEKVEKGLSAGDPCGSGFVSLNYLKIVLDTFVFRLPRRVFLQLMTRFGLKTTAKINWKQFLTSFYNPPWLSLGNSVPMTRRNSNFNSRNQPDKENIITKLSRRAEEHCTSLKKALLLSMKKCDGSITGKELQRTLRSSAIEVSDSELRELMQVLDPRHTGLVRACSVLNLLLEEENRKIRKRSPRTGSTTSFHLAWDSVEEMVRDGITRNLQAFYNMLRSYDLGDTGFIGHSNFKKIMRIFCPLLTGEHVSELCSKFQDAVSGRILYKKLLANIGINGLPTASPDPVPTGQLVIEPVWKAQQQQQSALAERIKPTEEETPVTKNLTRDEVIEKLRLCIQQGDPSFQKQFLDFSKEPNGKINKEDFQKVLEAMGMPMDAAEYSLLTTKLGFNKEGMSYLDFATRFEEMSGSGSAGAQTPVLSASYVNSHFITAEECLKLFPRRVKEFFRDPYSAFFKIDSNRDGIISMQDLHKLLLHLLLNLKDEEFERFLELLGLKLSVTLNFREFRSLCEKGSYGLDEAPQRLIRPKQKVTDAELACEQAHQYLVTKAKHRWPDLSKNFIETDNKGNGILRRRDIKNALYGFDIPLTPREFEKLWTRYDTEGRGFITYQEFLQKLGISYSPIVHRPYAEDHFNFLGHFTKPQQVQEEIRELQQTTEEATRDKLKGHFQEISKALSELDQTKEGCIPLSKMQAALQECGCALNAAELAQLLNSWGVSWQDNSVNYLDFLKAVDSSKPARPPSTEKEESKPIDFAALGPEEVLKKMQEVVNSSQEALSKTFSELDQEDTGFVKAAEFGQVLKDFCHKLSDSQYHYFLRKLRIHLSPHINWKYFLQNFNSFLEETAAEWAEKMSKAPPPPKDMGKRDILDRLHKAVTSHYNAIVQEFENFDTMKTNAVSRDEFRAICNRHVQILTDDQFDRLWSEMPVTSKGKLKYQEFLSKFSSEKAVTAPASGDSTKAQKGSSAPDISEGTRSTQLSPTQDLKEAPKMRSHPCTAAGASTRPPTPPLQNCEPIERKLRRRVQCCWRELLKECKEKDTNKEGEIHASDFLALVEKFNLDISKEESQQLIIKYDLKNNGKFAYCDFIQSCILLLKAKETSLMQRMKIQNMHKMKEAGMETSSFYSALLRIQPQILHCWRPMRRTFKTYDQGSTGFLNVADFRKVLRQYSINLSEEEFFHILEYYDKALSSKISYNDFLRAFLQ